MIKVEAFVLGKIISGTLLDFVLINVIYYSLLKLIHPPLNDTQKEFFENMMNIKTGYNRTSQQSKSDKIYSISDLCLPSEQRKSMDAIVPDVEEDCIWRASTAEIDWKTVGFGTEFAI